MSRYVIEEVPGHEVTVPVRYLDSSEGTVSAKSETTFRLREIRLGKVDRFWGPYETPERAARAVAGFEAQDASAVTELEAERQAVAL